MYFVGFDGSLGNIALDSPLLGLVIIIDLKFTPVVNRLVLDAQE